jgi:hypothetical protein
MQAQAEANEGPAGADDAAELKAKALDGLREAQGAIESFARRNPRTAVGIAVGVGFVLGGGLTPRILLGLGAYLAKNVARDYAKSQLRTMTRSVLEGEPAEPKK